MLQNHKLDMEQLILATWYTAGSYDKLRKIGKIGLQMKDIKNKGKP